MAPIRRPTSKKSNTFGKVFVFGFSAIVLTFVYQNSDAVRDDTNSLRGSGSSSTITTTTEEVNHSIQGDHAVLLTHTPTHEMVVRDDTNFLLDSESSSTITTTTKEEDISIQGDPAVLPTTHTPTHEMVVRLKKADTDNVKMSKDDESPSSLDLQATIADAIINVNEAEEIEINKNQSMLRATVRTVENSFKFALGKLFGESDDMGSEALQNVAEEVSKRLEQSVQTELRQKADKLVDSKADDIESVIEQDERDGISIKDIKADIRQVDVVAVEELKIEIDAAALNVEKDIASTAALIEQTVIQEQLGQKVNVVKGKLALAKNDPKKDDDDKPRNKTKVVNKKGDGNEKVDEKEPKNKTVKEEIQKENEEQVLKNTTTKKTIKKEVEKKKSIKKTAITKTADNEDQDDI